MVPQVRLKKVRRIKMEMHEAVYGCAMGEHRDSRIVQALLNEALCLEQSVAGFQLTNPDVDRDLNPRIQQAIK